MHSRVLPCPENRDSNPRGRQPQRYMLEKETEQELTDQRYQVMSPLNIRTSYFSEEDKTWIIRAGREVKTAGRQEERRDETRSKKIRGRQRLRWQMDRITCLV